MICSVYSQIIRRSTTVPKAYCFNGYVKKKKGQPFIGRTLLAVLTDVLNSLENFLVA